LALHTKNQAIALLNQPPPPTLLSNPFRAVYEANGWKKRKFVIRKAAKNFIHRLASGKTEIYFYSFFSRSLASPSTNKNCYFIAKPYLYVFCCAALSLRRENLAGAAECWMVEWAKGAG
jgi:hypothetical protein